MNERDVTTLLERRAAAVPPSDPPIDEILAAARRDVGGQRHRTAFVAAAAVLVLIVAAGVAWDAARDESAPPLPAPITTDTPLSAHDGSRWAGFDGIALEVPASWTTSDSVCSDATDGTVVIDWRSVDACPAGISASESSLHIGTLDARNFIAEMVPPAGEHHISIDGVPALRTDPVDLQCGPQSRPGCTSVFGVSVQIPSKYLLAWVVSADRSTVVDIAASARVIPDGYVAVPSLGGLPQSKAADQVGALGLHPESLCPDGGAVCDGGLAVAQTDPLAGSVVPEGSTVQLLAVENTTNDFAPSASIDPDGQLLLTTAGSSTCPEKAEAITAAAEAQHVTAHLSTSSGDCTADPVSFTSRISRPSELG